MTDAAGTVDVTVINNEENIFMPFHCIICCWRKTAKLTVETPSAAEGVSLIIYNWL